MLKNKFHSIVFINYVNNNSVNNHVQNVNLNNTVCYVQLLHAYVRPVMSYSMIGKVNKPNRNETNTLSILAILAIFASQFTILLYIFMVCL